MFSILLVVLDNTAALLSFSFIITMSDDGQELFFIEKFHMSKQWSEESPILPSMVRGCMTLYSMIVDRKAWLYYYYYNSA